MGEGKSSVGVKVDENNAPIGEETRGSSSRRRDVVKSVSKASRRYNVTREQEAGFVSRGDWCLWTRRIPKAGWMRGRDDEEGLKKRELVDSREIYAGAI
jgi:hypothetical protein